MSSRSSKKSANKACLPSKLAEAPLRGAEGQGGFTQIREQILVYDLYVFTLNFEIPQQPIKKTKT